MSGQPLHVGIVCPYSLDVPGGVQSHVLGLARALLAQGHTVDVLAPASGPVPSFVTSTGRALGVPYNGSVARIAFGPASYARVRRWLDQHRFDVLHLHEPTTISLSVLALIAADGPIVATFHTATERSRVLSAFGGVLRPLLEKVTARIAVSPHARRVQVEHLGGDAVEIPNGVDVDAHARGPLLPGYPRPGTVGFLGRFDEPRKGMDVLLDAVRTLAPTRPDLRVLVVGRGDVAALCRLAGPVADRLDVLGPVDDATKAAALRSMEVYCAPHVGGESFGMVLTEAMAAGTPVLASDLDAFRAVVGSPVAGGRVAGGRVAGSPVAGGTVAGGAGSGVAGSGLAGSGPVGSDATGPSGPAGSSGPAGWLFPAGDGGALAVALDALLDDPVRRTALSVAGRARAAGFDWSDVGRSVVRVYRAAIAAAPHGDPPPRGNPPGVIAPDPKGHPMTRARR